MKLLNFGCGSTFHPDWINVDLVSSSPAVQIHDIRTNLPYPNEYFDACYSSHAIEHMRKDESSNVIDECYRVLKPQGIVRIVVPDLESIVKAYLTTLERVVSGVKEAESEYDWMIIEMLDQLVRSSSGGEMGIYLSNPNISERNKDFIRNRIGAEAENYWKNDSDSKSLREKITSKKLSWFFEMSRSFLLQFLVFAIGGTQSKQALKEGLFRNSGEIHRWMYDRYSLQRLLERSGFINIHICSADESQIPDFNKYGLDILKEKVRKPDSLFIEAFKPGKVVS
jgi:predicted SAM-dependent methyltransferase